jgi:hypothetical protein
MGFVCSVHTFPQFLAVALVLGGDAQILGVPRPVTLVQGSLSSSLFRLPRFDKDDGAFKVTWPVRSKTGRRYTINYQVAGRGLFCLPVLLKDRVRYESRKDVERERRRAQAGNKTNRGKLAEVWHVADAGLLLLPGLSTADPLDWGLLLLMCPFRDGVWLALGLGSRSQIQWVQRRLASNCCKENQSAKFG